MFVIKKLPIKRTLVNSNRTPRCLTLQSTKQNAGRSSSGRRKKQDCHLQLVQSRRCQVHPRDYESDGTISLQSRVTWIARQVEAIGTWDHGVEGVNTVNIAQKILNAITPSLG